MANHVQLNDISAVHSKKLLVYQQEMTIRIRIAVKRWQISNPIECTLIGDVSEIQSSKILLLGLLNRRSIYSRVCSRVCSRAHVSSDQADRLLQSSWSTAVSACNIRIHLCPWRIRKHHTRKSTVHCCGPARRIKIQTRSFGQ